MTENEKHIGHLFTAELQFRLASAVRLATTLNVQPLDLPTEWSHSKHSVTYDEIALRQDQADYAAHYLHRSATLLMAVAMKDAIRATVSDPKASTNPDVRSAYQIVRMIRNAFAHAPLAPTWCIDKDCQDQVFEVHDIITLDTKDLDGTPFDWRHYGGPLALFRLCRFVRIGILKDQPTARKPVPALANTVYQQGSMIFQKVDAIPVGAVRIEPERLPDGSIHLRSGHFIRQKEKEQQPNRGSVRYLDRFQQILVNPTLGQTVDCEPLIAFSHYLSGRANVLCSFAVEIIEDLDKGFSGQGVDGGRVERAESLMWFWLLGAYEVVRTMHQAKGCFSERLVQELSDLKKMLTAVRMPAAKMEKPGKSIAVTSSRSPTGWDIENRDLLVNDPSESSDISARWILLEFDRVFSSIAKNDVLAHHEKAYAGEPNKATQI